MQNKLILLLLLVAIIPVVVLFQAIEKNFVGNNGVAVQAPAPTPIEVSETSSTAPSSIAVQNTTSTQTTSSKITIQSKTSSSAVSHITISAQTTPLVSPSKTVPATSTVVQATPLPSELPVNPQTIVGIVCTFDYNFVNPVTHGIYEGETARKGSGVIVSSRGHVITNRHLLESPDTTENLEVGDKTYQITVHYALKSCAAGRVPAGTVLPTRDQIVTLNPLTQVPGLAFKLNPIYIHPREQSMTYNEGFFSDFALLQIYALTDEASNFGITTLPSFFEYAKLLPVKNADIQNREVITYGFPGDVSRGQGSDFQTLYFTGSVGSVAGIVKGELYYYDTPLYIRTNMEINLGRSGSPLFWRGYVVGLVMAEDSNNRKISYSVASDVILRDIQQYLNQ